MYCFDPVSVCLSVRQSVCLCVSVCLANENFTAKSVDVSWRHVASKVCPMLKYNYIYDI